MLELRRLLDAGYDVMFQHGDGTAASQGDAPMPRHLHAKHDGDRPLPAIPTKSAPR